MIGRGTSGLVSAYVLAKAGVEFVLYDKEDSLGSHAKTVTIHGVDLVVFFHGLQSRKCYRIISKIGG